MVIGTLIKQPNEKYCVINYAGEVARYNLTEQDIISMYIEDAKAHMGAAKHYGMLVEMTVNDGGVADDVLKDMGFNTTYQELLKHVPLRPLDKTYVHCDFTTYGKCPNCGNVVRDAMGWTDKECKCGQLLKW